MTICRTAGPLEIDGLRISSLNDLTTSLSVGDVRSECLFADLSLGAWFGYIVAQQLCVQLGIQPPKQIQPSIDGSVYPDQLPDYGGKISEMIDSENSGNRVLMTALELAEQVTEGIQERRPKAVVIIAPRFGFDWEVENELFIEFLVRGLRDTDSRCILAFADSRLPDIPVKWKINWINGCSTTSNQFAEPSLELLTLVPGVIEPGISGTIIGTAPLDQS